MPNRSSTIHVVDDDASFRAAIGDLLKACGYRVSLSGSAEELLASAPNGEAACILLDVQMAGMSGPELQQRLGELGCTLPVIFVTGHGDIATSVKAIKTGAEDFLTKPVDKEELLEAIERAVKRYEDRRQQDARMATLRAYFARLTAREREVLALLVRGKPHKQIAYALGTSERTIKLHRHNVMQKFEVQSVAQLAVIAERLGLLPR